MPYSAAGRPRSIRLGDVRPSWRRTAGNGSGHRPTGQPAVANRLGQRAFARRPPVDVIPSGTVGDPTPSTGSRHELCCDTASAVIEVVPEAARTACHDVASARLPSRISGGWPWFASPMPATTSVFQLTGGAPRPVTLREVMSGPECRTPHTVDGVAIAVRTCRPYRLDPISRTSRWLTDLRLGKYGRNRPARRARAVATPTTLRRSIMLVGKVIAARHTVMLA